MHQQHSNHWRNSAQALPYEYHGICRFYFSDPLMWYWCVVIEAFQPSPAGCEKLGQIQTNLKTPLLDKKLNKAVSPVPEARLISAPSNSKEKPFCLNMEALLPRDWQRYESFPSEGRSGTRHINRCIHIIISFLLFNFTVYLFIIIFLT